MSKISKYNIIGYFFIAFGLFFNEYIIKYVLRWGNHFNSPVKSIFLAFIELIFILIGVFIIRKKKEAVVKLLIFGISIIIMLTVLELFLSTSIFDNLSSDHPIWVPAKYKLISEKFYTMHNEKSKLNEFGFNDVNRTRLKKDKSALRVAVLGDSFIWGAAVPDSVIWTRKLENRFRRNGINCEVLNWGIEGWSTLDEFSFLTHKGSEFQFDYLIFAFVVNDPAMDSAVIRQFISRGGFVEQSVFKPVSKVFPNDISFFTDVLNNIYASYFDFGYMKWLQKLYSDENLKRYSDLIKEIKQYCDTNKIKFCFVLTPENHSSQLKTYFDKIVPILETDSVSYLNLYPYVSKELGGYSNRSLWANPADGHPGNLVTEVYSKYVFEYLKNKLSY